MDSVRGFTQKVEQPMLRRFLVAYLVLVIAAGPALCCCCLARLFAPREQRSAQPKLPPCCHQASSDEADEEQPPHRDCPCRQGIAKPAVIDRAPRLFGDTGTNWLSTLVYSLSVLLDNPPHLKAALVLPNQPLSGTAEDILCLCRQLRC